MQFSMLNSRNILTMALVPILALVAFVIPASAHLYPGTDLKPADPNYSYNKSVFECQPPDSLTLMVNTITTLADSTIGRPSTIGSYPCAPWSESGPELIYRLNVATDLQLSAVLADSTDLDLFLLDDCDTDNCLVGANTNFSIDLAPGIYYLIVDSVNDPGRFTLELSTREQGVPLAVCEPGGAMMVSCANDTTVATGENLFDQPDFIRDYTCGASPKKSGENWYALEQGPGNLITVQVTNVVENMDVNLWLFEGCGPDAVCLQYIDDTLAGENESLTWTNSHATENVTVYLAVDAIRRIEPIPPFSEAFMTYDIEFQCQGSVPVTKTPFGSLKSLYR